MSNAASLQDSGTRSARSTLWWIALGAVAAGQLFAFWLVCSQQVRRAEARRDEAVVQQMALSDCLQYIPGSTIASCNASRNATVAAAATMDTPAMPSALPVSFTFR